MKTQVKIRGFVKELFEHEGLLITYEERLDGGFDLIVRIDNHQTDYCCEPSKIK